MDSDPVDLMQKHLIGQIMDQSADWQQEEVIDMSTRLEKTAKAMFALHQIGLLMDPELKNVVTDMIRKASEPLKNWSNNTHYRSADAAMLVGAADIRTPSQYHNFCRRNLRHEHVVPNIEIYRLIRDSQPITYELIKATLETFCLRAIITKEENKKLNATRMPKGFRDPSSPMYRKPLGRYVEAGLHDNLEKLDGNIWF